MATATFTLAGLLRERAGAAPDAVAMTVEGIDGARGLTFADWENRSDALARTLAQRGVGVGQAVGLVFDTLSWLDFAVAYAGVSRVGAVPVPLGPPLTVVELARALDHCTANVVLGPPDLVPAGTTGWLGQPCDLEATSPAGPLPPSSELPEPTEVLCCSPPMTRPSSRARSGLQLGDEVLSGHDHAVLVHALPFGTAAAQDALWLPLRHEGARTIAVAVLDPDRALSLVAECRATHLGLGPFLAWAVAQRVEESRFHVPSLERVVVAARSQETVIRRLAHQLSDAVVVGADTAGPEPVSGASQPPLAPLTVAQDPMVWHEQLVPASFNLPPLVRRLEGCLEVWALEAALGDVVRRHEPLRTTFEMVGAEAVQVVHPDCNAHLTVRDLSGLGYEAVEAELGQIIDEATNRPVDLVKGPLFSPRLVRLGPEEHLLVVPVHHSVWDDWSIPVFHRELSTLYAAHVTGTSTDFGAPLLSFTDLAHRERRRLAGPDGATELSYWREELAGAPLSTQLPIGDPDLPRGSPLPVARPISVVLPAPFDAQLGALARRSRASPFMTMLAAFQIVLHRWVDRDDLLVATVVANRNRTEVEGLIGCFAKKVPLRLRLRGDPPFTEVVGQVRGVVLGALAHQDMAFDSVVQEVLGPSAWAHGLVPSPSVVFQTLSAPKSKLNLPGVQSSWFDPTRLAVKGAHFASGPAAGAAKGADAVWGRGLYLGTFLNLSVIEEPEGLRLVARGVFHPPAVERLLAHLSDVLNQVVARPEATVSELASGMGPGTPPRPAEGSVDFRGFDVEPARLEAALRRCEGIDDVAVAVRRDGTEPRLVAHVVAAGDRPPTLPQVRAAVWAELPGYAWPSEVALVAGLGPGGDGRLYHTTSARGDHPRSDRTTPEDMLRSLWADARGGEPAGIQEGYWRRFSFLRAVAMANREGARISARQLVRNRTVQALVADMEAHVPSGPANPSPER